MAAAEGLLDDSSHLVLIGGSSLSSLGAAEEVGVPPASLALQCDLPGVPADDELEEVDSETGLSHSQKLVGIVCVLIAIISWLLLSLAASDLKSPLYARYVVNSTWVLLFSVWLPTVCWKRRKCQRIIDETNDWSDARRCDVIERQAAIEREYVAKRIKQVSMGFEDDLEADSFDDSSDDFHLKAARKVSNAATLTLKHKLTRDEAVLILEKHLTVAGTLQLARTLFPWAIAVGWFSTLSGFMWFLSLKQTDIAINMTIFQSSCAVVYLLSVFVLHSSKLTLQKSVSVAVCIIGVALIVFTSQSGDSNGTTAMGLTLVIAAMLVYSFEAVCIEYVEPRYYRPLLATEDSLFFTALCGVTTFVTFASVVALGYYTGFTKVSISLPGSKEFNKIFVAAVLDTVFETALILGISYSNAVLICSGVVLIVPVTFVLDSLILGKYTPTALAFVGTTLIISGFMGITFDVKKWLRESKFSFSFGGSSKEQKTGLRSKRDKMVSVM